MILTAKDINNDGICGRLGNQLFNISSIYGLSKTHNIDANIDWKYTDRFGLNDPTMFKKLSNMPIINYREKNHGFDENIKNIISQYKKQNVYVSLNGYLQDYRYFHKYEQEIVNMFRKDDDSYSKTCSIHIRRGDYLKYPDHHPEMSLLYFNNAMNIIRNRTDTIKFKIYSDDIDWCQKHFKGSEFTFSNIIDPIDDLLDMAKCEHNIISNSTFSWWGAYLNKNKNKVVIRPELWFGPKALSEGCKEEGYKVPSWIGLKLEPQSHRTKLLSATPHTFINTVSKNDIYVVDPSKYTFKNQMGNKLDEDPRWNLCDILFEKNIVNKPIREKTINKIPKIIHQVWLGGALPKKYTQLSEKLKHLHPNWEYKLWLDEDVEKFNLKNIGLFHKHKNFGAKSDIFRYEILERFGGVYLDFDFFPIKPFDDLLHLDFFTGTGHVKIPELFNGLIGAIPNHKLLSDMISQLSYSRVSDNICEIMRNTGPYFFTDCFFENIKDSDNTAVLPSNFFYSLPNYHKDHITDQLINQYKTSDSYVVHMWNCSWQKK